jgi:hypothetical protein
MNGYALEQMKPGRNERIETKPIDKPKPVSYSDPTNQSNLVVNSENETVGITLIDGSYFILSKDNWYIDRRNRIVLPTKWFAGTSDAYHFEGRQYELDGSKSYDLLVKGDEIKGPASYRLVKETLEKFKHQQAYEDLQPVLKRINKSKPKAKRIKEPTMYTDNALAFFPTSKIKIILNALLGIVRTIGKIHPLTIALTMMIVGATSSLVFLGTNVFGLVGLGTSIILAFILLIMTTEPKTLSKVNRRWEWLREVKVDIYMVEDIDIGPGCLDKVRVMIDDASKTKDMKRVGMVCVHLKRLADELKDELDVRLETLGANFDNLETLSEEVNAALEELTEDSPEWNINKAMAKDLTANMVKMVDYKEKSTKTATLALHMSKYIDTRLALIQTNINIVSIEEIGQTFCGLVTLFKDLDQRIDGIAEQGAIEMDLAVNGPSLQLDALTTSA